MKILVGGPVRQDEGIFVEYLKSLDGLNKYGFGVKKYFILHNCEHLAKHLNEDEYEIYNDENNEYICTEDTHNWSQSNLSTMSLLRNKMIEKVISGGYDFWFMVDSDLILHPDTLAHLIKQKKHLIAEIFWTANEKERKSFWPNCWMYDQCTSTQQDVEKWIKPGVYEVGGTGACFLIHREVLENGVNYTPISNIKYLWGEDRWFCIRAIVEGYSIHIDTHYPAIHLYRQSDYRDYMKQKYGVDLIAINQ